MYKFIKIRHDIIKQCHEHYKEMKKFNYKLGIEISRNSTLKYLGALRGSFSGIGCPKRHTDALLAKTMIWSVRQARIATSDYSCIPQCHLSIRVDITESDLKGRLKLITTSDFSSTRSRV